MNLLEQKHWDYELPWGNVINPFTTKEIVIVPELVKFQADAIRFSVANGNFKGYKRGRRWDKILTESQWGIGHIIAKPEARTHFGTYTFRFTLPNFRGSWPAIWLVDLTPEAHGGMGLPPEIDIFEHFRKDSLLTRFHITHTFHSGPTYEADSIQQKVYRKWVPLDWKPIELVFTWHPTVMSWKVNGKVVMEIGSTIPNFPTKPMNLLIGAGVSLDWAPKNFEGREFWLHYATYLPLEIGGKGRRRTL